MNTDASWPTAELAKARVLRIQTKLHQWATDDPNRRFDDLYNLVYDPAVLVDAWARVRSNRGARSAGVDGRTARHITTVVGEHGFLSELREDLKARRFSPEAVREVMIPKRGGKYRRLGIATVRDRVVQAALKTVLEPILEADFKPCSYGFRRGRRVQDAIAEIHFFTSHSYEWIVEGDIKACFDEISHVGVQDRLRARVADKRILLLVKAFLKAGILSRESVERHPITGTPQGGILSPLLSNLALSVLDEHFAAAWESFATDWARRSRRSKGLANYRLVRYADDWVVLVAGDRAHAEALRDQAAAVLATNVDGVRGGRPARSFSFTAPGEHLLALRLRPDAVADRDAELGNGGLRRGGGPSCAGGRRPRRGNPVAAIAISGHRHLGGPREPRAFAAGPVAPPTSSPDLFPGQCL